MKVKVGKKYVLKDLDGAVSGFNVGDIVRVTEESSGVHEWEIKNSTIVGFCDSSSLLSLKGNVLDIANRLRDE